MQTNVVVASQFIRATRDSGYRSLAYAIAELIDNAIDAGARKVEVGLHECSGPSSAAGNICIAIIDDGSGMDKGAAITALRFGGTKDFGARQRLGRFGMGLPNASLSQTQRVDVFTRPGSGDWTHTYLDVEEIAAGRSTGIRKSSAHSAPAWVRLPKRSGTAVIWSACDRLPFKRASTIAAKLAPRLSRIYRTKLKSGFQILINEARISPVDPLFRGPVAGLNGTCKPYGGPLEYHVRGSDGAISIISIQFVELPVSRWHDLPVDVKRNLGIIGGAGMSILRAGREIEFGWHLFGQKRRENYDEWWRCELRFDPVLDELFGITNSKQGISPTPELRALLEPDLERIARDLNARARRSFQSARKHVFPAAVKVAGQRDRLLPAVRQCKATRRRTSISGYRYTLAFRPLATSDLFSIRLRVSQITVTLNTNHPFANTMTAPGRRMEMELLILSAARATLTLPDIRRRDFIRNWSDNLAAFIDA